MPTHLRFATWFLALSCATSLVARADTEMISTSDFDRWHYAFNGSPGFRDLAPTFSAVGAGAFDNFDGQYLVGFDTAAAGVEAITEDEFYRVNSVTVTVTHSTGTFAYDPTHDDYASYLDVSDPNYVADADAGRPVEIYGAGLRGGFAGFAFDGGVTGPPNYNEGSPYAFADPTLPGVRNAYAYDPSVGDVSNAVDDGLFSLTPWAVVQADGVTPVSNVT